MAELAERRAEARTRYYTREEAQRLGWDVRHPKSGGLFLEEQELVDYFPVLRSALGQEKPDFAALTGDGKLRTVIECKGDAKELDRAINEARDYAETINQVKGFDVRVAIGVAGTPDKFVQTRDYYRHESGWVQLSSHGFPLTQLPTPAELQFALDNNNGTTDVQLPDEKEFFDAAIRISRILRLAKIEEGVRPKIIGAIVLALYHGEFVMDSDVVLENINSNVQASIRSFQDVPAERREILSKTLTLSTADYSLRAAIPDIVHQLDRLNVRSIMRSEVDFLGSFYETFLRYGQDSKKLGIVFTPRHITRFCAALADTRLGMTVYDPACGTGGFLVAAFDRMMREATTTKAKQTVKSSLYGCDTNATVWALAMLNMSFRGDGKTHITYGSCFEQEAGQKFDRALMNPPFSQEGEPEKAFVDHALKNLRPGGQLAVVMKTSVMVDPDLAGWRRNLVENHHVLAVVSLPAELFYPTNSPTVILVVRACAPDLERGTLLAQVINDGYKISKKRRVAIQGSQLQQVQKLFADYLEGADIETFPNFATVIGRERISGGEEICAEQWLPSATFGLADFEQRRQDLIRQMSLAIANYPDAADELMTGYEDLLGHGEREGRPTERARLSEWFIIAGGKSIGASNYPGGSVPYISSGDSYNGIVDLVSAPESEIYDTPHVTISGFGQAYIQPWRFCARGNGGSAVRVLTPRFSMTPAELMWIVGQINAQRWRFHYGRMATVERLNRLRVDPPPVDLPQIAGLEAKIRNFRRGLTVLSSGESAGMRVEDRFALLAAQWKLERGPSSSVSKLSMHTAYQQIIGMGEAVVPLIMADLEKTPDHWFWALHAITGADPVPKQGQGDLEAMSEAWLKWGREQGYTW